MLDFILLPILVAAFVLVAPVLGLIAFFRVRRLQKQVDALESRLVAGTSVAGLPDVTADPDVSAGDQDAPDTQSAGQIDQSEPQPEEIAARSAEGDLDAPAGDDVDAAPQSDQQGKAAAKAGSTLEETVGAKWAVWVGGLALALGAIFLVRYSIEQGLLGPGARLTLGALFSLALAGFGEWTRRRGEAYSVGGFESANVPAILTAVGTLGAFATIYAAYQIYGFLGPAAAFAGLGVVAVGTMAAALLHGPLLAALGIAASFLVPFLVSSQEPNTAGLAVYALAVSAAAFGVGRLRLWRWLAIVAALGLIFFGLVLFAISSAGERPVLGLYILVAWAAIFYVFVFSLYERSLLDLVRTDRVAVILLSLVVVLALGFALIETDAATVAALVLMILVPYWSAQYWSAIRLIIPIAGIAAVLGYSGWEMTVETWQPLSTGFDRLDQVDPTTLPGYQQKLVSLYGGLGVGLAVLAALSGVTGALRSAAAVPLAFGATFVPILILGVSYVRTEFLAQSIRYGAIALVLSATFTMLAGFFERHLPNGRNGREGVVATSLVAAISALTLGLAMLLDRGVLTVALALVSPATAFVYMRRPLATLRPVALVPAILWVARVAWDPAIVGEDLGTTPVFNWLTYGYGVPAAGFVMTAYLLGKDKRDLWLEIAEGLAVATVTAAIALVGLHILDPQQVFTGIDTLAEAALLVFVGGGVALGLLRLQRTGNSETLRMAAYGLGFAGMAAALVGLLGVYNPLITGEPIGTARIFNKLLFAYLLTGLLYGVLGLLSGGIRPLYSRTAYAVAGILGFAWVTLTIRHWFHPVALDTGAATDAELYAYSAAWLAIGIATLAAGMLTGVRALRLVSGAIIVVVVAKVFVVDMSNLTGALRALSFIGLGAVLVAIGLVYQRLLRRQK
ncbi:MAG: DUF2339 domain-containing protein [Alphaproteobacteria bacterium]|nr:DUF2339 domain-containing protein [Alphaproteobacteria bacterium]